MKDWKPILESRLLQHAIDEKLTEVTEQVLAFEAPRLDIPLFLAYRGLGELAAQRLNRIIRTADALYSTRRFGLFDGIAGLGWVTEHIARMLGIETAELNGDVDDALLRELERGAWNGTLDWPSGLAGIGVYFRERLPVAAAARGLKLVEGHLGGRTPHAPEMEGPAWQAHKMNCAWQSSGNRRVREEAAQLIDTLLRAPLPSEDSFLCGAAGTGLVLLSAATDVRPAWNRCVGLS